MPNIRILYVTGYIVKVLKVDVLKHNMNNFILMDYESIFKLLMDSDEQGMFKCCKFQNLISC